MFLDLPLELLPVILSHLQKPHHLATACLVSKKFHQFAVIKLYERVSIYSWQKEGKVKVLLLFSTLAQCHNLARYVRRLEIRDFPKSAAVKVLEIALKGLMNCVNLRACTWTRDGSLNSDILRALQTSSSLQELEINGHDDGNYDPDLLKGFTGLNRISLIMPSAAVINRLASWIELTGDTLQTLMLICKTSPLVTDSILESLAPNLVNLKHLHITGCTRVSHHGVLAVILSNISGITALGLEGISTKFDMAKFSHRCAETAALARLQSISLTVHQQLPLDIWMNNVLDLLSLAPLEIFQIYSTGAFFEPPSTNHFWSQLVTMHGHRLKRFSVHRMLVSLDAIDDICRRCTSLEQLFIVIEPGSLNMVGACLAQSRTLRSVHINHPLEAQSNAVPVLSPRDALSIIRQCSSTLTQFGCNARVWQVVRTIVPDEDGILHACPSLSPYEGLDIPEPFLVVRT